MPLFVPASSKIHSTLLHLVDLILPECNLLIDHLPFFNKSSNMQKWFEKRMRTISDDVPLQQNSLSALQKVLSKLSNSIPEPDILYSADGERIELSWKHVGLFIRPEYVVMFRPKSEQWTFLLDDDQLAIVINRLI